MRKQWLGLRGSTGKRQFERSATPSYETTRLQPQPQAFPLAIDQSDPSYMQPDWGETHGPVGKLTTFRYLTSSAYGLAIDHLDVVTAFLNSHVDDPELYAEPPMDGTMVTATATAAAVATATAARLLRLRRFSLRRR